MYANSILVVQNYTSLRVQNPNLTIYPTKDAYVNDLYPTDPAGLRPWLYIADNMSIIQTCQTFIYFDLPSNYSRYKVIMIQFHVSLWVNDTFYVDFYKINQNWDESSIIWNNKPPLGDFMFNLTLLQNHNYSINIKDYLVFNTFSICITASYPQENYWRISSTENSWDEIGERFVIDLMEIDPIDNFIVIGIIIISIVAVVGIGTALYFYYTRRKQMKSVE
ncbi:MAG: DNRLRE domain-containing protein [Candidatus Hodarchaeota archaeon]